MDGSPVKAVKAAFNLRLIITIIVVMLIINFLLSFVPQWAGYFYNPRQIFDRLTGTNGGGA